MYAELFLTFLKIGAFSFGGGYGMISLIKEEVVSRGWMSEGELIRMIAVSESTPGPIAVNMATFVGSSVGGIFGAFLATFGVVFPSFLIILLISTLMKNLLSCAPVNAFLCGVRPCVVGLIIGTALTMLLGSVISFESVDARGAAILLIICAISPVIKRITKKKPSPILLICISALLGMIFYSV